MRSNRSSNSSECCIIIPTYNNSQTLGAVICAVMEQGLDVMVINDGSTDSTAQVLETFKDKIQIIHYQPNRGKGMALRVGFDKAIHAGYRYAITIDSDGQHFASDIPKFIAQIQEHPDTMIVGCRFLEQENMPSKNSFANRFSNFWFTLQTLGRLPDTQSGFRLYPLRKIIGMRLLTTRYECELEMLVRLAWSGTELRPIPISVYYAPQGERISHFRPGRDFLRISLLNTALTILALVYGYPRMAIHKIFKK